MIRLIVNWNCLFLKFDYTEIRQPSNLLHDTNWFKLLKLCSYKMFLNMTGRYRDNVYY